MWGFGFWSDVPTSVRSEIIPKAAVIQEVEYATVVRFHSIAGATTKLFDSAATHLDPLLFQVVIVGVMVEESVAEAVLKQSRSGACFSHGSFSRRPSVISF